MKKAIVILGALAVILVAGAVGMCYYLAQQLQLERNRSRTEKARQARWDGAGDPEEDPEDQELENLEQQQSAAAAAEGKPIIVKGFTYEKAK